MRARLKYCQSTASGHYLFDFRENVVTVSIASARHRQTARCEGVEQQLAVPGIHQAALKLLLRETPTFPRVPSAWRAWKSDYMDNML